MTGFLNQNGHYYWIGEISGERSLIPNINTLFVKVKNFTGTLTSSVSQNTP